MEKIIIVAMTDDRVIGKNNQVPWRYPEDLEHFREKTTGHPVIMGRKTFESLPADYKPLPDRVNIVLTENEGFETADDVKIANDLEDAWELAQTHGEDKAFIIGGETVYRQVIEEADKMIVTEIPENYDGDAYFPEWNEENWKKTDTRTKGELSIREYIRT